MKQRLFLTLIFFSLLLLLPIPVLSCSCFEDETPPCVQASRYDAVFVGKIARLQVITEEKNGGTIFTEKDSVKHRDGSQLFKATFAVQKMYKGKESKQFEVFGEMGSSCTGDWLNLKKGASWTVFAHFDDEKKIWRMGFGMCSPSFHHNPKGANETFLENFVAGKTTESLRGTIINQPYGPAIPDVKVKVSSGDFSQETVTGKAGNFEITVPKAGEYDVQLSIPSSSSGGPVPSRSIAIERIPVSELETIFKLKLEVPKGQCSYSLFGMYPVDFKATAEISGEIKSSKSGLKSNHGIQLCKLGDNEKDTLSKCSFRHRPMNTDSFMFNGLREGRFTLVISENDFPTYEVPFRRLYYPGVTDYSATMPLELSQGQKISGLSFNIPAPLPTRKVQGQIVSKNGKPLRFSPDEDINPAIFLYNPNDVRFYIGRSDYEPFNNKEKSQESRIKINRDGTFSADVFEGFRYLIRAYIFNPKKESSSCGFYQLEPVYEDGKSVKIIIDRVKRCNPEDFLNDSALNTK